MTAPAQTVTPSAPARPRARWTGPLAIALLLWVGLLVFARLGHYPLWDDEATTAIIGHGVWLTGDTSAVYGDNIMGYDSGAPLRGLYEKCVPPLQFYVVAPFVGLVDHSAFVARLPFAVAGLAAVAVLLYWLWRDRADTDVWVLFGTALATAVPLVLYLRQCRYYPLAILATVAIAYLYLHRDRRPRSVALGLLLSALMLANYIAYFATAFCLLLDYAVWGRRERKLSAVDWLALAAFQLVTGAWVLYTRNPLLVRASSHHVMTNSVASKFLLVWYNVRDLNAHEMAAGLVVLAAPIVWWVTRDRWLLRSLACFAAYLVAAAAVLPTKVDDGAFGEVRYLSALIPLCLWIEVLLLRHVWRLSAAAAVISAAVLFGTNVVNRPIPTARWMEPDRTVRSTFVAYLGELLHPPADPYTATIDWIDKNVRPGQTIWATPPNAAYPLMFHQPKAVYAWQFTETPGNNIPPLPAIHTFGKVPVDYIISWGTRRDAVQRAFEAASAHGARYEPAAVLATLGSDRYRPEILWRRFSEPAAPVAPKDMIYVFRRTGTGSPETPAAQPAAPTTSLANPSADTPQSPPHGQTP